MSHTIFVIATLQHHFTIEHHHPMIVFCIIYREVYDSVPYIWTRHQAQASTKLNFVYCESKWMCENCITYRLYFGGKSALKFNCWTTIIAEFDDVKMIIIADNALFKQWSTFTVIIGVIAYKIVSRTALQVPFGLFCCCFCLCRKR